MSLLRGILLGAIGVGKVQSVLAKKKNRLIVNFPTNDKLQINFDIIKSWKYNSTVRLTTNPVEQGININDHRIIEPKTLTIEVGVSNIPNPLNAFSSGKNVLNATKLLFTAGFSLANSPVEATNTMLQTAMLNSNVFDIDTPIGLLKDFLILNVESTNDSTNYGGFEGTITIQEVLTFSNERVNTKLSGINKRQNVKGNTTGVK